MTTAVLDRIVFIAILVIGLGAGTLCLFGAIVYDFGQIRLKKKEQTHPNSRALRARPLVSVAVIVGKPNAELEKSLLSIAQNRYRNCEIVLISEDSKNELGTIVEKFHRRYPSKQIRLLKISEENLANTLSRKTRSEFVFVVSSNQLLDENAVHHCVKFFALNPKTSTVRANIRSMPAYTVLSLQKQFEEALSGQWSKCRSLIGSQAGTVYRRSALESPDKAVRFCPSVIIYGKSKQSNLKNSSKNHLKRLGYLFVFALATYSIYIALLHQYPALAALCWASTIFMLDFGVWSDEQLAKSKKIRMLFLAPMASLLFYLLSPVKMFRP